MNLLTPQELKTRTRYALFPSGLEPAQVAERFRSRYGQDPECLARTGGGWRAGPLPGPDPQEPPYAEAAVSPPAR